MRIKFIMLIVFLVVLGGVLVALQVVKSSHLEQVAVAEAEEIYSWVWPAGEAPTTSSSGGDSFAAALWSSRMKVKETNIVSRTDKDAVVKVKGVQTVAGLKPGVNPVDNDKEHRETVECSATLTFYRRNDRWELGRAEFD